jgi:ligand-binding sensor domain-containing protein
MRSFLAANPIRFFGAAACWILLAVHSDASDSNKPLTEDTHTVRTHKDGIPSAFIYSIARTTDGYLWLATTDGLVQFDGVKFIHWRRKTGHTELLGTVRSPARPGMEVCGSGLAGASSDTFVGMT